MSGRSERAEAVRALAQEARYGLLATHGLEPAGIPYGSLVPCATNAAGEPLVLISHLAQHTKNLVVDQRASILLARPTDGDPQESPRATLLGTARRLEGEAEAAARARYLAVHPDAGMYFDLNFELWALRPEEARYVGGFGAAAWVAGSELVDP